jgi:hypothetical protein
MRGPPYDVSTLPAGIDAALDLSGAAFEISARLKKQVPTTGARDVLARERQIGSGVPRLCFRVLEIEIKHHEILTRGDADQCIRPLFPPGRSHSRIG